MGWRRCFDGKGGETLGTLLRVGIVAGVLEILVDRGLIHWVSTGRLVVAEGLTTSSWLGSSRVDACCRVGSG